MVVLKAAVQMPYAMVDFQNAALFVVRQADDKNANDEMSHMVCDISPVSLLVPLGGPTFDPHARVSFIRLCGFTGA